MNLGKKDWIASEQSSSQRRPGVGFPPPSSRAPIGGVAIQKLKFIKRAIARSNPDIFKSVITNIILKECHD